MDNTSTPVLGVSSEIVKKILFLWSGSLIFIIITFLIVFFKIRPTSSATFALHYNVLFGVDTFGSGNEFYKLPIISLIVTGINFLIYKFVTGKDTILSFVLVLSAFLVSLIILVATLFLLRVN